MRGMSSTLHTELRDLLQRHLPSKNQDSQNILMELQMLLARDTPAYEYRHNLGWDGTWMELDESQLELVLERGHAVQRRRIMGGWEDYTGGRTVPEEEPEFGMHPADTMAPRPDVPHSERIFAASRELFEAWERSEPWAVQKPLHEAYVLFFLDSIMDAITDLINRWKDDGMVGPFPDSLEVQDELRRIVCLEDARAAAAEKDQEG